MMLYPVILEHAAAFIERTPWEVSRDAALLYRAHRAAWEFYRHTPVVCGIDVYHQEIEAWGAVVEQPAGNAVPQAGPPVLDEIRALLALPELCIRRDGRLPVTLDAARRLQAAGAEVCVPMAGPVSIAAGLLGFESVLIGLLTEPETMREALQFLAVRQCSLASQWHAEGLAPVLYESAGGPPLVSPSMFRALVAPALRALLAAAPMPCILGGDTARIVEDLLSTGPTATICPAETDQAAFLAHAARWPDVAVRINLPAATLATGDWEQITIALDRAAALADGHPRASLGTGVLPYTADRQLVHRAISYAERKVAAAVQNPMRSPDDRGRTGNQR